VGATAPAKSERSARNIDGFVLLLLLLLGRRMGFEPGLLVGGHLGGGFAQITDGFQGDLAGDAVGLVFGRGFDGGGPAFGGVEQLGQGLAQVGVAGAVVVEIVVELVGDGGELLDEVVGVLLAAGAAGLGVEVVELLGAQVEELDEEQDAVGGDVPGFADLFDLGVGEGGGMELGVKERGEDCSDCDREDDPEGTCAGFRERPFAGRRRWKRMWRVGQNAGVLRCAQDDSKI
jgi:hypothetical protein